MINNNYCMCINYLNEQGNGVRNYNLIPDYIRFNPEFNGLFDNANTISVFNCNDVGGPTTLRHYINLRG